MSNKHTLVCLVGESGSGKTAVHKRLEELGYIGINSYTTRPPRYEGEDNHIFVTDSDYIHHFLAGDIVAYTFYNNYHYYCTRDQASTADVYVVDPDGVAEIREKMGHQLNIIVVELVATEIARVLRMKRRGDSQEEIDRKLAVDREKFTAEKWRAATLGITAYAISNVDLDETVAKVVTIIEGTKGGAK